MKISTDQLVAYLSDIRQRVATGDSFEGSFSYSCLADGLKSGEWEVNGAYRIANTHGQGVLRILSDTPNETRAVNAPELQTALEHLEALVRFAYKQGFHKLGYNPLHVVISAIPQMVDLKNSPRLSAVGLH